MMYKTLCLQLIQECPQMHDRLRSQRLLLPTMDQYAAQLKAIHETWMEQLRQARPGSDPKQIASAALELALQEMQDRLPFASPPAANEPLSLDDAMKFIRTPMPHA